MDDWGLTPNHPYTAGVKPPITATLTWQGDLRFTDIQLDTSFEVRS